MHMHPSDSAEQCIRLNICRSFVSHAPYQDRNTAIHLVQVQRHSTVVVGVYEKAAWLLLLRPLVVGSCAWCVRSCRRMIVRSTPKAWPLPALHDYEPVAKTDIGSTAIIAHEIHTLSLYIRQCNAI